jgi:protein gp37
MSDDTKIEWTDATWNPVTGCTEVSPGCDHCYAKTFAERWRGITRPLLRARLRRRPPTRQADQPMSLAQAPPDLRQQHVRPVPRRGPGRLHREVFAVMAAPPEHTFQLLTKRHGRMRSLLSRGELGTVAFPTWSRRPWPTSPTPGLRTWPLRNIWLGVSVENQQWADIRIPALLDTPAAVRWISAEPLLGPVDLDGPLVDGHRPRLTYWLTGRPGWGPEKTSPNGLITQPFTTGPRLDWVVAGGESGHGARPMHPEWAQRLRNQCVTAGVPFLFKQWGEYDPMAPLKNGAFDWERGVILANDGTVYQKGDLDYPHGPRRGDAIRAGHDRASLTGMYRVGKKNAGRELDGRTWDEYPAVATPDAGSGTQP